MDLIFILMFKKYLVYWTDGTTVEMELTELQIEFLKEISIFDRAEPIKN